MSRRTENPCVGGSISPLGTIFKWVHKRPAKFRTLQSDKFKQGLDVVFVGIAQAGDKL